MALLGVAAFRVSNPWIFLLLVTTIVSTLSSAAIAATALQIITPNQMRGQVAALYILVINGIGLGLGPTLVGALTDFVMRDEARLGDALTILFAVLAPAAALAMWLGRLSMRRAVAEAAAWRQASA